jgi:hypothetical protein
MSVDANGWGVEFPNRVPAGQVNVRVFSAGPQPHELNGLSHGVDNYLTLDLQPGEYVAICNIPDPDSGMPHSRLGMIQPSTDKETASGRGEIKGQAGQG